MAMRPGYIPGGRMAGNNSGMMMNQGGPMPPPMQQQGGNQFPGYMNVQQLQQSSQQGQSSPQNMANFSRMQQQGMMNMPQNFQRGGYNMSQQQMQMAPNLGSGMNLPGTNNQLQNNMGGPGPNIVNNVNTNTPAGHSITSNSIQDNVRNVWRWNLEEQMAVLRDLVERYKYISIDCKFPGIVARPIGTFKTTSEYHYQTLRSNVDILQVVQIGMSFADEFGNRPVGVGTWQFNFKFNINEDMCSTDGLDLLRQGGVGFEMNEVEGIDVFAFGELLISSGLVLDDSINWITYHSGYDLGYLLSVMLNDKLPVEEAGFLQKLNIYFPTVWDVKHIVRMFHSSPKSSLAEIAEELNIRGSLVNNSGMNSSGSEAILNSGVFFELRRGIPDIAKARGGLFGLGDGIDTNNTESKPSASQGAENDKKLTPSVANVFQYGKMGGI